ncbi:MAG: PAS domain S-box protein, partial [Candidatus Bipolaricaulota bacterium]
MALSSKRTKDKTQQALYDISHTLLSAENLSELAKVIQEKLDPILNTKNFFLALCDKEDDTISFPYFADQRDQLVTVSAEESLTGHLIRGGIPLLLTGEEIEEMVHAGEVVVHGTIPKAFLGVPLKAKKETVGALVVQSYTDKMAYNKEDLQILNSVSSQLGLFMEHKQVEQALRSSEKRLRSLYENVPSGIYQTTPSGKFIAVNQALVRMFGYNSAEELLTADAHDLYLNITDRDHYRRELEKRGRISGIELVLKRKDGHPLTVLEHAYVIRDEKGNTLYYEGILTDISERVRMEQLQQALHRIAVAGHTAPSLPALFNTAKEQLAPFLRWEDSFIALYSKENDTLSLLDVNDQFRAFPAGKSLTAYVVRKGETVLLSHEEIEHMIDVGEIEAIGATPQTWLGIPLRADADIIGILVLRDYNNKEAFPEEDLTVLELIGRQIGFSIGYREAQEALQNSEQRYHSIFVASIDGVLVLDLDGRIVDANPAACKMYGYTGDELVGLPAEKLVRPDYFHGFSNFRQHVERNGRFLANSVNLRKDGTQFNIELRGTRFSYHGQPHLLSIIIDTTERAKAQKALEDSKQKIERLCEITQRLETSNTVQDVYNITIEAAEKILNFSLASLDIVEEGKLIVKATSSELPSGASREARLEQGGLAGETYRSGKTTIFGSMDEVPIAAPTRKEFSSGISAPIGDIGVFQVVSTTPDAFTEEDAHLLNLLLSHTYEAMKRINLERQLREQAIRDPLTGVYNRRYFTQVIEREITRSKRYGHGIAFLMVDIDRFKEINDRFGHQTGDRVLQQTAKLLEAQLRDVDVVIRYGGDEFLLVLPETTD